MGPGGLSMGRKHLKFVQISRIQVVQLELHPFLTAAHLDRFPRNWFQDDHLMEVAELLQPVLAQYNLFDQSYQKNKDRRTLSQDCLVGPTVRLGFILKPKAEHQSLVTSSQTCWGRKSARVKDIKLIIYVCPRLHGSNVNINSAFSQLLTGERNKDQSSISQYFHKTAQQKSTNHTSTNRCSTSDTVISSVTDSASKPIMSPTNTADTSFSSSLDAASKTGGDSGKAAVPGLPDKRRSQHSARTLALSEPKPQTALKNLMSRRDETKKKKQARKTVKSSLRKSTSPPSVWTKSHSGVDLKAADSDRRCPSQFDLKDKCTSRGTVAESPDNDESSQDELPDLTEQTSACHGHHRLNANCSSPAKSGRGAEVTAHLSLPAGPKSAEVTAHLSLPAGPRSAEVTAHLSLPAGPRSAEVTAHLSLPAGPTHSSCSKQGVLSQASPSTGSKEQKRKSAEPFQEDCYELPDLVDSYGNISPKLRKRSANDKEDKERCRSDLGDLPDSHKCGEKKTNVIPTVRQGKKSTVSSNSASGRGTLQKDGVSVTNSASGRDTLQKDGVSVTNSASGGVTQQKDDVSPWFLLSAQGDSNELPDLTLPREPFPHGTNGDNNQKEKKKISSSAKFPFYYSKLEKSSSCVNGRNSFKKSPSPPPTTTATTLSPQSTSEPVKKSPPTFRCNKSSPLVTSTPPRDSPTGEAKKKSPPLTARSNQSSPAVTSSKSLTSSPTFRLFDVDFGFSSPETRKRRKMDKREVNVIRKTVLSSSFLCTGSIKDSNGSSTSIKKNSLKSDLCSCLSLSCSSCQSQQKHCDGKMLPTLSLPRKQQRGLPRKQQRSLSKTKTNRVSLTRISSRSHKKQSQTHSCSQTGDDPPPLKKVKQSSPRLEPEKAVAFSSDKCSQKKSLEVSPRKSSKVKFSSVRPSSTSPPPSPLSSSRKTGEARLTEHATGANKVSPNTCDTSHNSPKDASLCWPTPGSHSTLTHTDPGRASDISCDSSFIESKTSAVTRHKSDIFETSATKCQDTDILQLRSDQLQVTGTRQEAQSLDITCTTDRVSSKSRKRLSLTDTELERKVLELKGELKSVVNGTLYSERHQQYMKGGNSRSNLDHDSKLGFVKDGQEDVVMDALLNMFGLKSATMMDYMLRVLLHEAIMKVYQQITGHSC